LLKKFLSKSCIFILELGIYLKVALEKLFVTFLKILWKNMDL
jgi:hypothetical protein